MKFDLVLTNPPFQDYKTRGKTRHKLWIDFTKTVFDRLLRDGGTLCQVSPASFQSASSHVLELMKANETEWISFETARHFPDVGSTFADYAIRKTPNVGQSTEVEKDGSTFCIQLDRQIFYLPNDLSDAAMSVHRKVVAEAGEVLSVEKDYVTCHNVLLKRNPARLSKTRTVSHVHPVLHTKSQTWYSSVQQEFATQKKVMWSRSGYTRPFYDDGVLGGTDMAYYVRVRGAEEGEALAHNLNLRLFRYIFATARWSGFGNERVFCRLPRLPLDRLLTDLDLYELFELTTAEVKYVERAVA